MMVPDYGNSLGEFHQDRVCMSFFFDVFAKFVAETLPLTLWHSLTWSRLDWRDQFLCLRLRKGPSPCEENGPVLRFLDKDKKELEIVEEKTEKNGILPKHIHRASKALDDWGWTLDILKRVGQLRFGKFNPCFHCVFTEFRLICKGHNVPTLQWATLCSVPLRPCLRCLG